MDVTRHCTIYSHYINKLGQWILSTPNSRMISASFPRDNYYISVVQFRSTVYDFLLAVEEFQLRVRTVSVTGNSNHCYIFLSYNTSNYVEKHGN